MRVGMQAKGQRKYVNDIIRPSRNSSGSDLLNQLKIIKLFEARHGFMQMYYDVAERPMLCYVNPSFPIWNLGPRPLIQNWSHLIGSLVWLAPVSGTRIPPPARCKGQTKQVKYKLMNQMPFYAVWQVYGEGERIRLAQ